MIFTWINSLFCNFFGDSIINIPHWILLKIQMQWFIIAFRFKIFYCHPILNQWFTFNLDTLKKKLNFIYITFCHKKCLIKNFKLKLTNLYKINNYYYLLSIPISLSIKWKILWIPQILTNYSSIKQLQWPKYVIWMKEKQRKNIL